MDIRSSLDGLKSLLGVPTTAPPAPQTRSGAAASGSSFASDRATLSSAGSEVSLTAAEPGVRMEKVASIQAALKTGTYNVPASAVASKVVDAMLGGDQ